MPAALGQPRVINRKCLKTTIRNFGTWNVRTLLNNNNAPIRTAVVIQKLRKHNIDIAVLSEIKLADEGTIARQRY